MNSCYHSSFSTRPDVITYRLGTKLVFVGLADNYQQALDLAQREFPEELRHIPRNRISLGIQATLAGVRRSVRISESAWAPTAARLLRGQVVDVQVRPAASLDHKAQLPKYSEVPELQVAVAPVRPRLPVTGGRKRLDWGRVKPSERKYYSKGI